MEPILKLKGVSFIYHMKDGETLALHDVNFEVEEGEFVALVGPSGCGKTTILSLLAGLLPVTTGKIFVMGKEVKDAKNLTALMPQRDQLFEWRSILKNVTLGLEINHNLTKEKKLAAEELLVKYGLGDFIKKKPAELSGGMRQRAALIRTLVTEPKILLLDEPFGALDFQTRLRVVDDVHSIIKAEKKTALLVTHDISEAISLSDKIVVLSARPATVQRVIDVDIPRDLSPLERREHPKFQKYFDMIWKDLTEADNEKQKE